MDDHATRIALAPYACDPERSRGRLIPEEEHEGRSCFQRDRDRIIHSAAFRRLEYKTQVFIHHEGDHHRNRLTHSLEVAQLARSISRHLGLNEDLAEALALAHDLGHTPFGHAGEDALEAAMKSFGGFDHNAQTLRVLTLLEHRYAAFDGLNLTWETLEGVAKHNGPVTHIPRAMAHYQARHDLELSTYAGGEAQAASLADDIAYNNHDIDDGLRAGMISMEQLADLPLIGDVVREVRGTYPGIAPARLAHETVRRMIHRMVVDVVTETEKRIAEYDIETVDDIRALGKPLVGFSVEMQDYVDVIRDFLLANLYRHYRVNRMATKARRVVRELFELFLAEPECLPTEWRALTGAPRSPETACAVADYIAGMTDRYALDEHRKLFDVSVRP